VHLGSQINYLAFLLYIKIYFSTSKRGKKQVSYSIFDDNILGGLEFFQSKRRYACRDERQGIVIEAQDTEFGHRPQLLRQVGKLAVSKIEFGQIGQPQHNVGEFCQLGVK